MAKDNMQWAEHKKQYEARRAKDKKEREARRARDKEELVGRLSQFQEELEDFKAEAAESHLITLGPYALDSVWTKVRAMLEDWLTTHGYQPARSQNKSKPTSTPTSTQQSNSVVDEARELVKLMTPKLTQQGRGPVMDMARWLLLLPAAVRTQQEDWVTHFRDEVAETGGDYKTALGTITDLANTFIAAAVGSSSPLTCHQLADVVFALEGADSVQAAWVHGELEAKSVVLLHDCVRRISKKGMQKFGGKEAFKALLNAAYPDPRTGAGASGGAGAGGGTAAAAVAASSTANAGTCGATASVGGARDGSFNKDQ